VPDEATSTIDYKDVTNWLNSRGAENGCPVCGGDVWHSWDCGLALMILDTEGSTDFDKWFPVAVFVCSNCAFVRLHSPGILKESLT
jgi:hypothetical protein